MADPVVDGIVSACSGATVAQIVAALRLIAQDRRTVARTVLNESPWALDGGFTNRWVHVRGQQYAAGTAGVLMAEITDRGSGTAAVFTYRAGGPPVTPDTATGSPLDGMVAVASSLVPTPVTKPAAYQVLADALATAPPP